MKMNWKSELVNYDGKKIHMDEDGKEPATLGKAAIMALNWDGDTREVDGAEKYRRFDMMMRIHNEEEDFSTDEVATIEKLIGKAMPTAAAGAVIHMLSQYKEGNSKRGKTRS